MHGAGGERAQGGEPERGELGRGGRGQHRADDAGAELGGGGQDHLGGAREVGREGAEVFGELTGGRGDGVLGDEGEAHAAAIGADAVDAEDVGERWRHAIGLGAGVIGRDAARGAEGDRAVRRDLERDRDMGEPAAPELQDPLGPDEAPVAGRRGVADVDEVAGATQTLVERWRHDVEEGAQPPLGADVHGVDRREGGHEIEAAVVTIS